MDLARILVWVPTLAELPELGLLGSPFTSPSREHKSPARSGARWPGGGGANRSASGWTHRQQGQAGVEEIRQHAGVADGPHSAEQGKAGSGLCRDPLGVQPGLGFQAVYTGAPPTTSLIPPISPPQAGPAPPSQALSRVFMPLGVCQPHAKL